MPIKMSPRLILVTCLAFCLAPVGCDSVDEPVPDSSSARRRPPSDASPVAPVVAEKGTAKPRAVPTTSPGTPAQSAARASNGLPTGPAPENVFAQGESENEWTVVATPAEFNTFEVVDRPATGSSRTQFFMPSTRASATGTSPSRVTNAYQPRTTQNAGGLPAGFRPAPGTTTTEEGLPLRIVCEADDLEMVLVPAGAYLRGSNSGPDDVRPEHTVYLDAFYISVHEVTLAQYEKYRAAHFEERKRRLNDPANVGDLGTMPVLGINNRDASGYAEWAKCALPTEAQWEKAARGTKGAPFPWGHERAVWAAPRTLRDISPVMSHRTDVSPYGVYDMAGNAREWVADAYGDKTYREAGENGEKLLRNPAGPRRFPQSQGVIRGNGDDWKIWSRTPSVFSAMLPDVGFRCVLNLTPATAPADGNTPENPAKPAF